MSEFEQTSSLENKIVDFAVSRAADFISCNLKPTVDSVALIIDDYDDVESFTLQVWLNSVDNTKAKIEEGVPKQKARWLYEFWDPEAPDREIIGPKNSSTERELFLDWAKSGDRSGFYGIAVAIANRLRELVDSISQTPILVDNNHEYDQLVYSAIEAANPDQQAKDWLRFPPPDCE